MENNDFIETARIHDIPWLQLTTAYGRATSFPKYFEILSLAGDKEKVRHALNNIIWNVEHQSTLWHATPFALIFLTRIFRQAVEKCQFCHLSHLIASQLLDLFLDVAQSYRDNEEIFRAVPPPFFSEMLAEHYLWPEDESEDESRFESEEVFPDELFYGFWHYSYLVLRYNKAYFECVDTCFLRARAQALCSLL